MLRRIAAVQHHYPPSLIRVRRSCYGPSSISGTSPAWLGTVVLDVRHYTTLLWSDPSHYYSSSSSSICSFSLMRRLNHHHHHHHHHPQYFYCCHASTTAAASTTTTTTTTTPSKLQSTKNDKNNINNNKNSNAVKKRERSPTKRKSPFQKQQQQQQTTTTTTSSSQQKNRHHHNTIGHTNVMMSSEQAQELFDDIAPHVPLQVLRTICQHLKRKKSLARRIEKNYHEKIHSIWKNEHNKKPTTKASPPPPIWIQKRIQSILLQSSQSSSSQQQQQQHGMGKLHKLHKLHSKTTQTTTNSSFLDHRERKTYAPLVNRKHQAFNTNLVIQVRTILLNAKAVWRTSTKPTTNTMTASQQQQQQQQKNKDSSSESNISLQKETARLLDHLADSLPTTTFQQLMDDFNSLVYKAKTTTNEIPSLLKKNKNQNKSKKPVIITELAPLIHKATREHTHLIAHEVANYFLGTGTSTTTTNGPHSIMRSTTTSSSSSLTSSTSVLTDADWKEKRMALCIKQWTELRQRFGQILPEFQQTIQPLGGTNNNAMTQKRKHNNATAAMLDALDPEINLDHIPSTTPPSPPPSSSTVVVVGTNEEQENDKNIKTKNLRKRCFANFDAMYLADTPIPPVPDSDKMVLVENLPIDITKAEFQEYFSHCGPIQDISIFNQRLDLDPGVLSRTQIRDRRKNILYRNNMTHHHHHHRQQWNHPTSPVYGMITFQTQEGYDNVMGTDLRLFGMVVRKHPMRPRSALDCTTLFVEQLPRNLLVHDLEMEFGKALKENDIALCLELGSSSRRRSRSRSRSGGPSQHQRPEDISDCQISFPSFELAHHNYDTILQTAIQLKRNMASFQGETDEEAATDVVVNWIQTRNDAMQYWTREIGFET